jgi:hypothetical protein
MNSKPRVAVVAASLDILGGQGVQASRLVDALARDGYAATFLPINPRFPSRMRRVRDVPYLRTSVNQMLYLPSLARLASVDIVHVFSASYWSFLLAPVPAMAVARSLRKRVVLHYHSGEADDHICGRCSRAMDTPSASSRTWSIYRASAIGFACRSGRVSCRREISSPDIASTSCSRRLRVSKRMCLKRR